MQPLGKGTTKGDPFNHMASYEYYTFISQLTLKNIEPGLHKDPEIIFSLENANEVRVKFLHSIE